MEMVVMHPCEQKETINKLQEHLTELRVNQQGIAGDVSHIKTRIDNGMSHTIKDIHDRLVAIAPVIEHHASIVKRIEDFGWLISRWVTTGLVMVLLGVVVWAIANGYKP